MNELRARSLTPAELARELQDHSDPAVATLAKIILDMDEQSTARERYRRQLTHRVIASKDALRACLPYLPGTVSAKATALINWPLPVERAEQRSTLKAVR